MTEEDNILRDGTLIDLCGATIVWRSALGLIASPVRSSLLNQFIFLILQDNLAFQN